MLSLSPNLTEIVFALGLGDRVVGVSSDSDWPAEAKQKPKMGTFWQPNTEAIIAAKPDLVVCESFLQHKEVAETLKRAGIECRFSACRVNRRALQCDNANRLKPPAAQIKLNRLPRK